MISKKVIMTEQRGYATAILVSFFICLGAEGTPPSDSLHLIALTKHTRTPAVLTGGSITLACPEQKIAMNATEEGLWLKSQEYADAECFRVVACALARDGERVALSERGILQTRAGLVRWERAGMVEEYSSSPNGVRQDFVVLQRPEGSGDLRVNLAINGATTGHNASGVFLTLPTSGREIAYGRLRVIDDAGRELPARIEAESLSTLTIVVTDAGACYPIRVDPTFSDANWVSLNWLAGTSGTVTAIAADTNAGLLYVGGQFYAAGTITATNIAVWNGTTYLALGSGLNGAVAALAVDNSGALYVGGAFTTAGGLPANRIAKWSGGAWSALGSGMDGNVSALAVDASGNLYAGGSFASAGGTNVNFVAKWNGSVWTPLGSGMGASVLALAFDGVGNLYAGGNFSTAGGAPAQYLARWDGNSWSAVGTAISNTVNALLVDGAGHLFAGCTTSSATGIATNGVVMWDGVTWNSLNSAPFAGTSVNSLARDNFGNVYAGGSFNGIAGIATSGVAKWDGANWSALGGGVGSSATTVFALSIANGALYAGGSFSTSQGPGNFIAKWEASTWSALPPGSPTLPNPVLSMATDSKHNLYVGGNTYPMKLDGTNWVTLDGMVFNSQVRSLVVDNAGMLYAGGSIALIGVAGAVNVAKWDGTSWSPLGTAGLPAGVTVNAIACDNVGKVYAGGSALCVFSDGAWTNLTPGIANMSINALVCNAQGEPVAGGRFPIQNVVSNYVAKWSTGGWVPIGIFSNFVYALAFDKLGNIYEAGQVTYGPAYRAGIAKWNGSSWSALATQGYGQGIVRGLACDSFGALYAAGEFLRINEQNFKGIARWDGNTWSSLGSGLNSVAACVLCDNQGHLYVGGSFTTAGTNYSARVAAANVPEQLGMMTILEAPPSSVAMTLQGNPGSTCFLQVSTNLTNWSTATSEICNSNGLWNFTNPATAPKSFFRAWLK